MYTGNEWLKRGIIYMIYTLQGMWTADIGDGNAYPMQLPGTLDENNIGYKDQGLNQ